MKRLIILACSARKKGGPEPVPAIERYDGPMWQILRNFMRDEPLFAECTDILALSAEFGLITSNDLIPLYERKMAPSRAVELRPQVLQRLQCFLSSTHTDICLALSEQYMHTLAGWEVLVPEGTRITQTDGPMGVKLAQFKAWLQGEEWISRGLLRERLESPRDARGWTQIAGIKVEITRDELLDMARERLRTGDPRSKDFREWYVLIDDQCVAPKWLISLISGLPTSRFDASEARRALLQLGVDIERVRR
jgi:hypothetical protein